MTRREPLRAPAPAPPPRRPPPPATIQLAADVPCQLGFVAAGGAVKWKRRVWVPASVSTFSVLSSCQLMRIRPGTRMIAGAPYARHCSPAAVSLAGSHSLATLVAAGVIGTLA